MSAQPLANTRLGRYVETPAGGEIVRAFVPPPLPPSPEIALLPLLGRLSAAERALGRLDGAAVLLPRQELFLYMYVRKEAVLSSQIEGTQSTLADLLRFETEAQSGQPIDDIREVSNYVDAMMYGLERLEEFPLSLRLIRELHARLLQSGRGEKKDPGEFRRSQNWIGGTRPGNALFVPPPVSELDACLDAFERFIHETESRLPPLIKAGLLHVQFETIHPFLDGNGRTGRLLVNLLLVRLGYPPAIIFKRDRSKYLRALARADNGDPGALGELMARAVLDNLLRFVVPAVAGPQRLVLLASLAGKDLRQEALRAAIERGRLRAQKGSDGQWRSTRQWVDEYLESRWRRGQ